MASRADKRWLKSVADPDLVNFFSDAEFDAGEYAKTFYEQREASDAASRVEKLDGLKRQTDEALRAEVVHNYKAFMHASEEIRSIETGIQTLKDLVASTGDTLQTFQGVRLVEAAKPSDKATTGRSISRGAAAVAARRVDGAAGVGEKYQGAEVDGPSTSRGLKLPEWLDQAPVELEELLLERRHQEAVALIRRVREFSTNVQNATNLGRGVEKIFQRVETMAGGLVKRLLADISAANTLTVWGFREHKNNFALLIALGHGEKAAISFIEERSAMIRRSLRLVEVTADPLSYVGVLSETFFGQIIDAVTAFVKLFCKSARIHERRAKKSGKSAGYHQIYQGVRDCGTAPFCRLVVWVNQQIDQYAVLMGRQIRAVTMGPQRVTRDQVVKKSGHKGSASGSWVSSGEEAGFRLGPVASSLFSIVSLMLEEGFAAAAGLNTMGLPVGVQLASRLVPDVTFFLSSYVDSVKENLVEAIRKDAFVSVECKLVRPEALCDCTLEEDEENARRAQLTSSARILVLEARDILDYALVLLEPPPPEDDAFGLAGVDVDDAGVDEVMASAAPAGAATGVTDGAGGEGQETQLASYYTRDEFLELEPVIVTSLESLLRTYLKETLACMRARRDELSSNQAAAVMNNITAIGSRYIPLLVAWCAELLPEIAQEEEVTSLRELKSKFQRSSQNPFRAREITSSSSAAASASKLPHEGGTSPATSPDPRRSSDAPLLSTGETLPRKASSRRSGSGSGGGGGKVAAPAAAGGGAGRAADVTARENVPCFKQTLLMRASASANTGAHLGANSNASSCSSSTSVATATAKINASFTSKPAPSPPSFAFHSSQPPSPPSSSKAVSSATSFSTSATTASSRAPSQAPAPAPAFTPAPAPAPAAPSYTHYRRPSQIIAGPGGTQGSGMSRKLSGATGGGKSTSMSMSMTPSAQAEAAAKAAAAAAASAAAVSAGIVRSSPSSGPGASGEGVARRPTMTLKSAKEAREAKAKAAADAKAAREAGT